ncbi:uncharacterized protein LOC134889019 [Pseudophryne corroboree]|uniref:uncharacterized protein LOC134889019 n=1 Tax=Pseudophryne corroboree TaxID=495146 RepID=UPI003081AD1F
MEDRDACCTMKDQMFSDYDSDETIVDDSITGSDEEIDELQLKRLFLSSDISVTLGKSRAGQQSPEIQHMCKSVTRMHLDRMKTATKQVCEILSEEEASQSLLRNWTKGFGNPDSIISSKESKVLLDHENFSGLCEDSQHLIQSTECEVQEPHSENESPETSLLTGVIIRDHSNPEKEPVLLDNDEPQNEAPELIPTSERGKVESASEETVCSLEPPDPKESRNLPRTITSGLNRNSLLEPLSDSESMTQMEDMVDSQEYLSFMEVSTDDNSNLISEVLRAISSMQSPEVQSTRDQLGHIIVSDYSDGKSQIIMTQHSECYDDHNQEPGFTFVHEDGDHGRGKDGDIFPIQKTDKEEREETSCAKENAPQRSSPFHAAEICGLVSSHCPGAEQQLLTEVSLQGYKETCTIITEDQSHTIAADDHALCTQFSPSVTNNAKPTVSAGSSATCAVAGARSSWRIRKQVRDMAHNDREPPATPLTQKL